MAFRDTWPPLEREDTNLGTHDGEAGALDVLLGEVDPGVGRSFAEHEVYATSCRTRAFTAEERRVAEHMHRVRPGLASSFLVLSTSIFHRHHLHHLFFHLEKEKSTIVVVVGADKGILVAVTVEIAGGHRETSVV